MSTSNNYPRVYTKNGGVIDKIGSRVGITCLDCNKVSYDLFDISESFCDNCKKWHNSIVIKITKEELICLFSKLFDEKG